MSNAVEIIREMKEISSDPGKSVKRYIESTGKPAVGCFPIYSPEELVYAAGALPVGMWGGQTTGHLHGRYLPSFCCSIMRANTEQSLNGTYDCLSAVIITTFCDTLKCIVENWKTAVPHLNIIPFVTVQNRYSNYAKDFMIEEYERVKTELERLLSISISEESISEAVNIYEEHRRTMREFVSVAPKHTDLIDAVTRHAIIKASYFMDKKEHAAKVQTLINALKEMPETEPKGKKIILTGLMAEPDSLLEIFDENDLAVVADDLAQESRQFRTPAPDGKTGFERMAGRILNQNGCAFLYDRNKSRVEKLKDLVGDTKADGIVYCQMKFCDPEEFDYPIIRKEMEKAGIPMLYLEFEQQMSSMSQMQTRIQSFGEMLANLG